MKNYQVYSNGHAGRLNRAGLYVRISPQGKFTFSSGVARLFGSLRIGAVFLLWDEKSRSVAFRGVEENTPGAFKLNQNSQNLTFCKQSFFRDVGWKVKITTTFSASWDSAKKTLELEPLPEESVSI